MLLGKCKSSRHIWPPNQFVLLAETVQNILSSDNLHDKVHSQQCIISSSKTGVTAASHWEGEHPPSASAGVSGMPCSWAGCILAQEPHCPWGSTSKSVVFLWGFRLVTFFNFFTHSNLQANNNCLEKVDFETEQGNIFKKSAAWRALWWDFLKQLQVISTPGSCPISPQLLPWCSPARGAREPRVDTALPSSPPVNAGKWGQPSKKGSGIALLWLLLVGGKGGGKMERSQPCAKMCLWPSNETWGYCYG